MSPGAIALPAGLSTRPSAQMVEVSTAELWWRKQVEPAGAVAAHAQELAPAVGLAARSKSARIAIAPRREVARALQAPQHERPREQQEGDEARHRIARQADEPGASRRANTSPKASGLPGFIAICQRSSAPSASTAGLMWSSSPTETPPQVTIRSAVAAARAARRAWRRAGRGRCRGRSLRSRALRAGRAT